MLVQKIKVAIKVGGSADPKLNTELQRVLDQGKSMNIPLTVLQEAIKRESQGLDKGSDVAVEIKGHSNFFFVADCFTDNSMKLRKNLHLICRKYGAQLLEAGGASFQFDKKGILFVRPEPDRPVDMDRATELAIETGAEDVMETQDDNGNRVLEFHSDPKDLHSVKLALTDLKLQVCDYRLGYIPTIYQTMTKLDLEIASKLMDDLLDHEEVMRVYDNINPECAS